MQHTLMNIRENEPAAEVTAISVVPGKSIKQPNPLSECILAKKGAKQNEQTKRFVHGYHKTAPVQ